jgi:hypothetical protein
VTENKIGTQKLVVLYINNNLENRRKCPFTISRNRVEFLEINLRNVHCAHREDLETLFKAINEDLINSEMLPYSPIRSDGNMTAILSKSVYTQNFLNKTPSTIIVRISKKRVTMEDQPYQVLKVLKTSE